MPKLSPQSSEKAHKLADYNPLILGPLGSCYGGLGDKAKALTLLEELNTAAVNIMLRLSPGSCCISA